MIVFSSFSLPPPTQQELVEYYQSHSLKESFKLLDTTLRYPYKSRERSLTRASTRSPGKLWVCFYHQCSNFLLYTKSQFLSCIFIGCGYFPEYYCCFLMSKWGGLLVLCKIHPSQMKATSGSLPDLCIIAAFVVAMLPIRCGLFRCSFWNLNHASKRFYNRRVAFSLADPPNKRDPFNALIELSRPLTFYMLSEACSSEMPLPWFLCLPRHRLASVNLQQSTPGTIISSLEGFQLPDNNLSSTPARLNVLTVLTGLMVTSQSVANVNTHLNAPEQWTALMETPPLAITSSGDDY